MELWILAVIGLVVSLYALYVKTRLERGAGTYRPVCDISNSVSCSKALSSPYSKLVLLPNALYGIVYYLLVLVLSFLGINRAILYLSAIALVGSLYLAYVSFFKQRNFCLVCICIYVINVLIFVWSVGI